MAVRLTDPPNPPTEATVMVAEFDEPARTVSEEVPWTLDTILKSCTLTVTFGEARVVAPFTPVTVTE